VKIPKQISIKKTVVIILISVLITTIGSYYAFATTSTSTFTISPGIYPGAPSYTIWKEGNYYFAKNSNGKIEFSGTDASQVIQSAINVLTSGKIFIKRGVYDITSGLLITDKNIILQGEGWGKYPFKEEGTVLYKKFNGDLITINYTSDYDGTFVIRDMALVSDKDTYTGSGIVVENAAGGWLLENLRIRDFDGPCIKVTNCGKHTLRKIFASQTNEDVIYYYNVGDFQWYDVEADWGEAEGHAGAYLADCSGEIIGGHFEGYYGIQVVSGHITIIGAEISNAKKTGLVLSSVTSAIIKGCRLSNNNEGDYSDGYGILVYASSNVIICGNRIYDVRSPHRMRYAIYESGAEEQTGNKYICNWLSGWVAKPINKVWSDTEIRNNAGYKTENSGTATIPSGQTSVTVNHGLAGAPTIVTVTPSADIGDVWVDSVTSTSFTIHCETAPSSDVTVYWYAEYKP